MIGWFRKMFKEDPICKTCEVLKIELEHARDERRLLLEQILILSRPAPPVAEPVAQENQEAMKPIHTGRKHVPFQVRQQMMIDHDQQMLGIMLEKKKEMMKPKDIKLEDPTPDSAREAIDMLERDVLGVTK